MRVFCSFRKKKETIYVVSSNTKEIWDFSFSLDGRILKICYDMN